MSDLVTFLSAIDLVVSRLAVIALTILAMYIAFRVIITLIGSQRAQWEKLLYGAVTIMAVLALVNFLPGWMLGAVRGGLERAAPERILLEQEILQNWGVDDLLFLTPRPPTPTTTPWVIIHTQEPLPASPTTTRAAPTATSTPPPIIVAPETVTPVVEPPAPTPTSDPLWAPPPPTATNTPER